MELVTLPAGRHAGDVHRLWFSRSGRRLLVLTGPPEGGGRLWAWDLPGRRRIGRRNVVTDREHGLCLPGPAFARGLRLLAFGDQLEDRRLRRRVRLAGPTDAETHHGEFAFTPDGRTLFGAVLGRDHNQPWRLDRWDLSGAFGPGVRELRAADPLAIPVGKDGGPCELAVSPAGDLLAVWMYGGRRVVRFRLPDGEPLPPLTLPGERPAGRLRWSPDGRTLAVAGDGVYLSDPLGTKPRATLDPHPFADLAFTPDGASLVGVRAGKATVWDVPTGKSKSFDWAKACGKLGAVAVAPDGLTAVAGGTRGRLVRWDL